MIAIHFLLSFLFHLCTNSLRKLLLMRWFILWFGSKDKYQCLIKTKTCITHMYAQPLSRVWFFLTPRTATCQAPLTTTFSRKAYWSGLPFPIQEIFLTQGLNLCLFSVVLPTLQVDSLPLSHLGSPTICGAKHIQNRTNDNHHSNHCLDGKIYLKFQP